MIEVITIVAVVIALAIVVILILAAMKPATFSVVRTASIGAPNDKLIALISDFHQWRKWSPWEDKDPDLKRTYDGAERGKGAVYAWEGNKNVGSGRMEILEATASQIVIKLDFLKPFEAHNQAEFTLTPQAGGTNVTWTMHGPAPFMFRMMSVFVNCDNMVGKDFEAGLANMGKAAGQ
jgi:hypothetical protein